MFTNTPIPDLKIFQPDVFKDQRGYFFESYNQREFKKAGIDNIFVQDNQSYSEYGILRGLHFQTGQHIQAKLVRVLMGEVLDVAVDLRKNSPAFGQHFSIVLSGENHKQLFIPKGFAHGFVVLSETALFSYKCDAFYNKQSESGINYLDPSLNIDWLIPTKDIKINCRDKSLPCIDNKLNLQVET